MLNVAIVGTGNIAPNHVEGLLSFPDKCKIVALADIYPEKAEAMKKKYSLDAAVFDSHHKMLEAGLELDLVHVCTPPYVHAEIAIDCMDHGINVVSEKPMAPSLEECDAMIQASERNHVLLTSIAQNRFRDSIYKLKKIVDSGLAGAVRVVHVNSLWWRGHSYYDLWWRGTWEKEGGGPTLNHAVHHIDMLNWLQGALPTELVSMLGNVMHDNSEVEDVSFSSLSYEDHSMAEVVASVVHHGEEQGIDLQCEHAKVSAPWSCKAEISQENGFPETAAEKVKAIQRYYESLPDLEYEGHTAQILNTLEALENGGQPLLSAEDGRRTIELITAIYKAGCLKQFVQLPIKKEDEFYTFAGLLKHAKHFYKKTGNVENFTAAEISTGKYEEKENG